MRIAPRARPFVHAAVLLAAIILCCAGCDESLPVQPWIVERPAADSTSAAGGSSADRATAGIAQGHHPPKSGDVVPIDPRQVITGVTAATWAHGKRCACSLVFDDTYWTHYTMAAPEMEARGFRGTFALVTGVVSDWSIWQDLQNRGHEIANHTRYHEYFSALTPEQAEEEIASGNSDILAHIAGRNRVASFVYPGGDAPAWSWDIVARYHRGARGAHGINPPTPENFMLIAGSGYYYPFSVDQMNANLNEAIAEGGWYVPYYHSLTNQPEGSYLVCPVRIFRAHLDYIAALPNLVWVAPFSEVAAYIRERDAMRYEFVDRLAGCCLHVWTGLDAEQYSVPLTLVLTLRPGLPDLVFTFGAETYSIAAGTTQLSIEVEPGTYTVMRFASASRGNDAALAAVE